jgi:uncharacterized paraquat-inducible protein A
VVAQGQLVIIVASCVLSYVPVRCYIPEPDISALAGWRSLCTQRCAEQGGFVLFCRHLQPVSLHISIISLAAAGIDIASLTIGFGTARFTPFLRDC